MGDGGKRPGRVALDFRLQEDDEGPRRLELKRRDFLRLTVAGAGVAALGSIPLPAHAAPATPTRGGTLVIATSGEPPHLNPVNNLLLTHYVTGQLYPSLLEYDFNMRPRPSLAESWKITDSGRTYTFTLVAGAKWTDGRPLTSADVKFSMEQITIPQHPSGKVNFGAIERIETPDPQTVVFRLSQPFAPLLSTLGHMMNPVLPRHIYEGTDILKNPANFDPKVTAGPFKFQEWVKGSHIALVRNDNYLKPGLPYLDRVVIRFVPDANARVVALETGEIDYIPEGSMPEAHVDRLTANPTLRVTEIGGRALLGVLTWGFNTRSPILRNKSVRQALAHAIDSQFIMTAAASGKAMVGGGPIHPLSWAYSPKVKRYEFNPDRARQMLDEAGHPERGGVRFPLRIAYRPDIFIWRRSVEVIADNLRRVGVDARLVSLDAAAYYPLVYERYEMDMGVVSWLSGPDPHQISAIFDSRNIRPLIFTNFMGYKSSDVDSLFDQGSRELDQRKRKQIYAKIQELITEDAPAVWPVAQFSWAAYKRKYIGLPPGPWSGSRDPLDRAWIRQG